jgi:hypothetical protein
MDTLILLAIVLVICAVVGYYISVQKSRDPVEGVALGCFLGPIGWLIAALLPTGTPPAAPVPSRHLARPAGSAWSPRPLSSLPDPPWVMFAYGDIDNDRPDAAIAEARRIVASWTAKGHILVEAVWQDA